ncbi:MAG: P-loop NTPase fold protein [Alphaproteobacteria bacterium]
MGSNAPFSALSGVPVPAAGHLTPEVPITSAREDRLGRMSFVKRFARALVNERTGRATGVTVGITGSWGTGKTSVLNLLSEYLLDVFPDALVVRFNPWSISSRYDVIGAFLSDLYAELKSSGIPAERKERLLESLALYWAQLAPMEPDCPPDETLPKAEHGESTFRRNRSLHEARASLAERLAELDVPVIVCIDELDRLQDSEIRAIAQLVRSVADFPTVSYVLAFDAFRVAEALGQGMTAQERYLRGIAYLEKIIQFQFSVPVTFDRQLRDLLVNELEALDIYLVREKKITANARFRELLNILAPGIVETPRDVKKVTGIFHVFESMVRGEVDWVDVLAFAAISMKHPQIAESIRAHAEFVLGQRDPTLVNTAPDTPAEEKLETLCPGAPRDPEILRLLGFLFPFFDTDAQFQFADENFDQVKHPRPLLTLLSLDILSNQVPRLEIEQFIAAGSADRQKALRRLVRAPEAKVLVPNFFRRFGEVYFELGEFDHAALWRDLSLACEKTGVDWSRKFDPRRRLIPGAESMLRVLLAQRPRYREVAGDIIAQLAEAEELALISVLLRGEIFAHGLFDRHPRKGMPPAMSPERARTALIKSASQCVAAMMNGTLLPRLQDFTPLWNMVSVGVWSQPCRSRLADVLTADKAFDAVVLMCFGGDTSTDPALLETVLDVDAFAERVRTRMAGPAFKTLDPSLKEAYRRSMSTFW